jgi:hypothetical protein
MAAHATSRDFATARRLLATSPDYRTRVAAVAVLMNFVGRDEAVRALFLALLESDGMVKGMASAALQAVQRDRPRPVAWRPAAPAVHAVLDGTSLFHLPLATRLLVATGATPADADPFLRGGGRMLLAFLGAQQPDLRQGARALLTALRGADLGGDVAPWRAWIASL